MYKRTSLVGEYNYLYTTIPIPIISTFPSRRPSMCVFTDQLIAMQDMEGETDSKEVLDKAQEEEPPMELVTSKIC